MLSFHHPYLGLFDGCVCVPPYPKGVPIPGSNGEGSLHDVELYDIDYTYSSAVIADLQSKGRKVMCYISAGTSEDFRDDINLFPEEVKGSIVSFGPGDEVSTAGLRAEPLKYVTASIVPYAAGQERVDPRMSLAQDCEGGQLRSVERGKEAVSQ